MADERCHRAAWPWASGVIVSRVEISRYGEGAGTQPEFASGGGQHPAPHGREGSVALSNAERGTLFSGDVIYDGELLDELRRLIDDYLRARPRPGRMTP